MDMLFLNYLSTQTRFYQVKIDWLILGRDPSVANPLFPFIFDGFILLQ